MKTSYMRQFFKYDHLPEHLQEISRPFGELAEWMIEFLPDNPEKTAGLRKLLECKDCAVRSVLAKSDPPNLIPDEPLRKNI